MAPQVMTCRVALVNVYDDITYRTSIEFVGFEASRRLVCTIGRNPDCDITIADPRLLVSRRHCCIVYDKSENSFLIHNNSETNGTYLGSMEVRGEPARLCDGDLVTFGGPTTVVREGRSIRNPHKFRVRCTVEPVQEEAPPGGALAAAGRERKRRRTEQAAGASERPEVYSVPSSAIEDSLTCEICCDLFDTPVAVACGHVFCRGCIRQWNRRNNHCPKCRDPRGSVITGRLHSNQSSATGGPDRERVTRTPGCAGGQPRCHCVLPEIVRNKCGVGLPVPSSLSDWYNLMN